jgi:hypothetical protein
MNLLAPHNGNPNMRRGAPSVNPKGRPLGARQRIAEKLIADIAEVWQECGPAVLRRLAAEEPAKLAQLAYGLVPKDVFLSVAQTAPGGLDPADWATLQELLRVIEQAKLGDVAPSEIFEGIGLYLRSNLAKTIEHAPAPPPPY